MRSGVTSGRFAKPGSHSSARVDSYRSVNALAESIIGLFKTELIRRKGHLLDEETVAMMAEHEVWWSLQPFLDDEDAIPIPDPARRPKQLQISNGTDTAYQLAKKHQIKLAWGTDTTFDANLPVGGAPSWPR